MCDKWKEACVLLLLLLLTLTLDHYHHGLARGHNPDTCLARREIQKKKKQDVRWSRKQNLCVCVFPLVFSRRILAEGAELGFVPARTPRC